MNRKFAVGALVALPIAMAALTACAGTTKTVTTPGPTVTVTATATTTLTATATVTAAPPAPAVVTSSAADTNSGPAGYPKLVQVSTLPDQVKNWFQMGGATTAVQVASGVWTNAAPGASLQDDVAAGALTGFCASIKAYEVKYLAGEERGGSCW